MDYKDPIQVAREILERDVIAEEVEERDPYELPECIIAKRGILNEQRLQAQNDRAAM